MTREQAASAQYLRHSFYTVYLVYPNGERKEIGRTQRKTGSGLVSILRAESVQNLLAANVDFTDGVSFGKKADRLIFSNGYRMEFGGTIRQEAS